MLRDNHLPSTGITPARGDETISANFRLSLTADHPRARGRDIFERFPGLTYEGSPPRAGTRRWVAAGAVLERGITPARGDETSEVIADQSLGTDHPRARGRDVVIVPPATQPNGSPPRGDKTRNISKPQCSTWNHPRARGRDTADVQMPDGVDGSPPRAGTRLKRQVDFMCAPGITPARGDETTYPTRR